MLWVSEINKNILEETVESLSSTDMNALIDFFKILINWEEESNLVETRLN